jgi:hypothetical protein
VDEHGAEADAGEKDEVADHRRLELRQLHRRAAVLDHHRLALESLDEGERLREHVDAAQSGSRRSGRCLGGRGGEVEAAPRRGGERQGLDMAGAGSGVRARCVGEEGVGEVGFGEEHGSSGRWSRRRWCSKKCLVRTEESASKWGFLQNTPLKILFPKGGPFSKLTKIVACLPFN